MASRIRNVLLRWVSYCLPERVGQAIARILTGQLRRQLLGKVTDSLLEILLRGMDLAFCLMKGFRKNIRDFEARYLFRTADGTVEASAIFHDGNMKVEEEAIEDWDTRVTFKDSAALRRYLFCRDRDILNTVLNNEIEVDGNLNLIYKWAFMNRDLTRRLGIET